MNTWNEHKKKLQEEQSLLLEELKSLGTQNPKHSDDWITAQKDKLSEADPNVVADRVEDYGVARSTLAQLETRLKKVKEALVRIEDGTYGVCTSCQEVISDERLMANPAANTCRDHFNET